MTTFAMMVVANNETKQMCYYSHLISNFSTEILHMSKQLNFDIVITFMEMIS